jgi:hypothetical protein
MAAPELRSEIEGFSKMKQFSRSAAFVPVFVFVFALNPRLRGQGGIAAPAAETEQDEPSAGEGQLVRDVRADLVKEQFDTLDQTADGFRRSKARWKGGGWKLRTLYEALDAPHQTDPDMVAHLEHLRHWMTARPESITARVALATSLTRWAWIARGNGTAEKVTTEGWQLFGQRIQEAQTVLAGSQDMKTMDPQWYSEEMVVGLAQGWDDGRVREVFQRGVQFEPDYQYSTRLARGTFCRNGTGSLTTRRTLQRRRRTTLAARWAIISIGRSRPSLSNGGTATWIRLWRRWIGLGFSVGIRVCRAGFR